MSGELDVPGSEYRMGIPLAALLYFFMQLTGLTAPNRPMKHIWHKPVLTATGLLLVIVDNTFARYVVVGLLSTVTHVGTLAFLIELFSLPVGPATVFAFTASLLVSFSLNYLFAFRADTVVFSSFFRFTTVALLGLLLNVLIMELFVNRLGIHYGYATLIAIAVVTANNFSLHYFWTFEKHRA